jgi:hypothetical protein
MSRKPDLQATTPSLPPERAAAIRAQVERILTSPQFRGSRRCLSLLRHIVEHTVTGETAQLKERTLGIEVFEREPDYDTSQDPVVRATAGEIRKKLAQYYQEPGHQSELRIDLLAGSYIAEFHDSATPAPAAGRDARLWIRIGLSIAGAAVVVLVLTLLSPRWKETELQRLWLPVLKAPGTIIISLGQPIVYNLKSTQAQDAIQGFAGTTPPNPGPEPDFILKKDLVILPDRYAAMGDVICLVHIAGMLEKYGKPCSSAHSIINGPYLPWGNSVLFSRRTTRAQPISCATGSTRKITNGSLRERGRTGMLRTTTPLSLVSWTPPRTARW